MASLGEYLKEELKRRDWSEEEFSRRANINLSHVYRIIQNSRMNPRLDTFQKIAAGLGKTPAQLCVELGISPSPEALDPEAVQVAQWYASLPPDYRGMFDSLMSAFQQQAAKRPVISPKSRPVNRRIRKLTGTEGGSSDELTRCLLALSPLGNVADQPNGLTGLARSADAALASRGT